jgi:uncharacterized protein (DUF2147 family)
MSFAASTLKRAVGGFVMAAALSLIQVGQAATPQDAIAGTWLTDDGGSKVDVVAIKAADGSTSYSGRVSWLKEPMRDGKPLRDASNDDAALRDRPILGLEILSGFKATGDGVWTGGMLYSPRRGESFPADLSLLPDGSLELRVKAGLMTKTVRWTR